MSWDDAAVETAVLKGTIKTLQSRLNLVVRWANYWRGLSEQEFQAVGEEILAILEGTSTEGPDDE